jgi:hypothetical protein
MWGGVLKATLMSEKIFTSPVGFPKNKAIQGDFAILGHSNRLASRLQS